MQNPMQNIKDRIFEQVLHANLRDVVDKGCWNGINFSDKGESFGTFLVQVHILSSAYSRSTFFHYCGQGKVKILQCIQLCSQYKV